MARKRPLHPDEHALWMTVARTARPLRPALTDHTQLPTTNAPAEPLPNLPEQAPMFLIGEKARTTTTAFHAPPNLVQPHAPLRMDAKAFGKMIRGKLSPEARIDLHGMTLSEAHRELISFILNAHSAGSRLVLVITGKGKPKADHGPIPHRTGVLRHQVPQWLRLPPLGPVVLQVSEAHLKHGGSGAYYVYLRRRG
jgi:DNA-nicking Smr family endonuclease